MSNIVAMSLKSQMLDLYGVKKSALEQWLDNPVALFREIDKMLEVQEVKDAMKYVLKDQSSIEITYEMSDATYLEHDWERMNLLISEPYISSTKLKFEASTVSPYKVAEMFVGVEVVEEDETVYLKQNKDKKAEEMLFILVDREDKARKRVLGVAKAITAYNETITANSVQSATAEFAIDYDDKGLKVDLKSYNNEVKEFKKQVVNEDGTWTVR